MRDLPRLGLGTSSNAGDQCTESVRTALDVGYRHVDTAQMYDNEAAVGRGLARSDVPREDVFLATKVHPRNLGHADVLASTEDSLERLGVDGVDLLYVHWPTNAYDPADTLPAFDELADRGATRHVGVSNFTVERLEEAREVLDAPVYANQIEIHPLLPPHPEMVEYCGRHDVRLVAYAPFARRDALDVPEVVAVADKHGVSTARTILAWLFEKGVHPIPKAVGRDHLADNYAALDLELDDEDVARIDGIERRYRRFDDEDVDWDR